MFTSLLPRSFSFFLLVAMFAATIAVPQVHSQENAPGGVAESAPGGVADAVSTPESAGTTESASTTAASYRVVNIEYYITGYVASAALALRLELPRNAVFESFEEFDSFLRDRQSRISNLRQLKTSSTISYKNVWNEEEQLFDVVLLVFANADWALFILPYFNYSDSSGLLLGARAKDYNFLGSLETLSIDFDFITETNLSTSLGGGVDFKYPFRFESHIFTLGFQEIISWKPDGSFDNTTGVSFHYLYQLDKTFSLLASVNQAFISTRDSLLQTEIRSYSETTLSSGVKINLNSTPLPFVNIISYTPQLRLITRVPLDAQTPAGNPDYSDIIPQIHQNISFGRVDWIQNFRQGVLFNLDATVGYRSAYVGIDTNLALTFSTHFTTSQIFGFNFRANLLQNLYYRPFSEDLLKDEGNDDLGKLLRGIIDQDFENSVNGVILNADFMFRLFSLRPLLIDEVHAGVFTDFGIRSRSSTPFLAEEDLAFTFGITGIVYTIFRSLYLRVSYGVDLLEIIRTGSFSFSNREIFIGLTLFY